MAPVDLLCKKARKLPNEAKELIWHYSPPPHPLATLVKGLTFTIGPEFYEPHVMIECPPGSHWVEHKRLEDVPLHRTGREWILWVNHWMWHDVENTWPDWVVKETSGSSSGNFP